MAQDALETIEYGAEPAVLLFGDSDAALDRARCAAERAGCRVVSGGPVARASERLDRQVSADAVVVELDGEAAGLAQLLDWIEAAARSGRCRSVVSGPEDLIDLIAAHAPHRDVIHLCRPSDTERAGAIALASARRPLMLHDIGRGEGAALLQQLSADAGRIASILASLSEDDAAALSASAPGAAFPQGESCEPQIEAPSVRAIIRARRLRDQYFQPGLFADPAWDMLLDLMAARLEGNKVAVSSLCIAAAVPATTALRWIKALTDQGLFVREADPQDGRRVYIALSEETARALTAYLCAVQRIAPAAI